MQWTAGDSSIRFRHTVQNFLLWWVGSDQQCPTGFLMMHGAMLEQGVTTLGIHFSCTMKLHTAKTERGTKTEWKNGQKWWMMSAHLRMQIHFGNKLKSVEQSSQHSFARHMYWSNGWIFIDKRSTKCQRFTPFMPRFPVKSWFVCNIVWAVEKRRKRNETMSAMVSW